MSSFDLKLIAMITMLVDHLGAVLFPQYISLRIIGRISFPIYSFLLVEGYLHTHNLKKYISRLIIFALISEIPFDLVFYNQPIYIGSQNIFFTLLIGLLSIYFIDIFKSKRWIGFFTSFILCVIAYIIKSDYSFMGVLIIIGFYIFKNNKLKLILYQALLSINFINPFRLLSFIPISFYNGKKGYNIKYLFYLFYPVHLLILYIINLVIR